MADVFISYSREDRARAGQIAQALERAGIDAFWDSEIPPGQTWADYIEGKLSACKAVIVLWSQHSTRSQWVREEARMGRDKGILIPVMIDASPAPFGFGEVQAADLSAWAGAADDPSWLRVLQATRAALGRPAQAAPRAAAKPAQSGFRRQAAASGGEKKKGVPAWAWVAGGMVGAVVILGIIGSMVPDPEPAYTPPQQIAGDYTPVPAPAIGPQPVDHEQHMMQQLAQLQQALGSQGFQQIGQPTIGQLNAGQTQSIPVQMHVGYEYRLAAVCDADCTDVDLTLQDGYGNVISQDTSVSANPVVPVYVTGSGNFTLNVLMYACSVQPCYYAAVLYGRPAS